MLSVLNALFPNGSIVDALSSAPQLEFLQSMNDKEGVWIASITLNPNRFYRRSFACSLPNGRGHGVMDLRHANAGETISVSIGLEWRIVIAVPPVRSLVRS